MTEDLMWLSYAAVLTAVLWVPYIVGLASATFSQGISPLRTYSDPTPPEVPAWVKRCDRAHINAVETLTPFAVMVLVAHVAGAANETTAFWAMVFFFARVVHAVVYWIGVPLVRTVAFFAGLVATLAILYEVISAAPAA